MFIIYFTINNVLNNVLRRAVLKKGTIHNDQGANPRRRRSNCKYLCTQHRSMSIHKANTNRHKRGNYSNTVIVGHFKSALAPRDR